MKGGATTAASQGSENFSAEKYRRPSPPLGTMEKLPAPEIIQLLIALRNHQLMRKISDNEETLIAISRLQDELRVHIQLWGGIESIEAWLAQHDLEINLPSSLKDLDLTWLEKK